MKDRSNKSLSTLNRMYPRPAKSYQGSLISIFSIPFPFLLLPNDNGLRKSSSHRPGTPAYGGSKEFQGTLVAQFESRTGTAEFDGRNMTFPVLVVAEHGRHVELFAGRLSFHGSGETLASLHVGEDGVAALNL